MYGVGGEVHTNINSTYSMVSCRAPGSLCSSLYAGIIKEIYFSAGSKMEGQETYVKQQKHRTGTPHSEFQSYKHHNKAHRL